MKLYENFKKLNPHLTDRQMVETLLQDRKDFIEALILATPTEENISACDYRNCQSGPDLTGRWC